jgi:hypothetical protein
MPCSVLLTKIHLIRIEFHLYQANFDNFHQSQGIFLSVDDLVLFHFVFRCLLRRVFFLLSFSSDPFPFLYLPFDHQLIFQGVVMFFSSLISIN